MIDRYHSKHEEQLKMLDGKQLLTIEAPARTLVKTFNAYEQAEAGSTEQYYFNGKLEGMHQLLQAMGVGEYYYEKLRAHIKEHPFGRLASEHPELVFYVKGDETSRVAVWVKVVADVTVEPNANLVEEVKTIHRILDFRGDYDTHE